MGIFIHNYKIMLKFTQRQIFRSISSELIKKDINKKVKAHGQSQSQLEYPKTFDQKIIFLNDPKTIQKL